MSISHKVAAVIVAAALATGGAASAAVASPAGPTPASSTPPTQPAAAPGTTKPAASAHTGATKHPTTIANPGTASPYDSWANAEAIPNYSGFTTGIQDTKDASVEPGEKHSLGTATDFVADNTIWAKWTAPGSGVLFAETFVPNPVPSGTAGEWATDTTLAIFTGSSVKSAKQVAYDDDSALGSYLSTIHSVPVKAGVTYHFQIGISEPSFASTATANSGAGLVELYASVNYVAPSNDNFGSAKTLTGTSWTAKGTTLGSTLETGETTTDKVDSNFTTPAVNSVWYKWTPAAGGTISFESLPTDLDSAGANNQYLAIYRSDAVHGGLTQAYYDQDSAFQDQITIYGQSTYYFQLGQVATDAAGPVDLNLGAVHYTGPLVTKLSATSGSHAGGAHLTLTGTGLAGTSQVCFGPASCTVAFTVVSATKVTVTVPALAKGKYAVFTIDSGAGQRSVPTSKTSYTAK